MSERVELEASLSRRPFDAELRKRYAALLSAERAWAEAVAQWQILAEQLPHEAAVHLALGRCQLELGDAALARAALARAKASPDYEVDSFEARALLRRLEQLARPAERSDPFAEPAPPRLRAIAGGAGEGPTRANVVSIARADVVRFADVVGMAELKRLLKLQIIQPFLEPGLFQRFKKSSGGGVLLYGPPGCGKTLMARAIATECKAHFTAIGISDILNMWIGQSERNLAAIFDKARHEAPAVLFFDELDALAFSRSKATSEHTRNLVNEFLGQLDGMHGKNEKVLVLAATNLPWD